MMEKEHTSFFKTIVKHFFVSILLGGIPTFIFFRTAITKTDFINKFKELFPDNNIQWYFIAGYLIFLLLSLALKFLWLDTKIQKKLQFIRDIFKEVASGFKHIIQTIAGVIFICCLLWYPAEPESFTFSWLVLFLFIGFIFIFFSAIIEVIEHKTEKKCLS